MGTSDSSDRTGDGSVDEGRRSCRARRSGVRLTAIGVLLGVGCLDLLGDVNVSPVGTELNPNRPGGEQDCPDAGRLAGTCVVRCEPGRTRCADNLLQRCNEAGNDWTLIDQCASAALCDGAEVVCRPPSCAAEEYRCTPEGVLQVCAANRIDFDTVENCTSAAYCSATPGRPICTDGPCRAGRQRCNGRQIERCRDDRTGYDVAGPACASAALCVENPDETASCTPPTCVPGTFACNGSSLTRCSDDANRYIVRDECGSPERCLAAEQRCADASCVAGSLRCAGNALQRCNATQNGYDSVDVCASAALCDASAGRCLTPDNLPDPSVLDGAAYDFARLTRPEELGLGPMVLRVPTQWADVDISAWTNSAGTVLGPRLIASTDAARFARNYDIPGVYFSATATAPLDVAARQQEFDMSSRCATISNADYEDDLYVGTARTYTNCGATQATISVVAALDKVDSRFVTVVIVVMTANRDEEARREIWNSFVADDN